MNYIDTCCLISFIDKKDRMRKSTRTDTVRNIESVFGKSNPRFKIPVPALGETVHKIHDRGWPMETEMDAHSELIRLMRNGFIEPQYIQYGEDVSRFLHMVMSRDLDDERDRVSPMDALITSMAVADPGCRVLYTTDKSLYSNFMLMDLVQGFRDEKEYDPMQIIDIRTVMNR